MNTLSKSDFQLASTCAKKLIYKKNNYPTSNDTNEYMEMLAQGGYVIGKMATMLYPDGIEVTGTQEEAAKLTREYLKREQVILFEAAIQTGQKIVRIDILEKHGNELHLIEVKSSSHNTEEDEYEEKKRLKKYIDDVAYQYFVLKEAFPKLTIRCSLLMPDKAKRTSIDGLAGWFSLKNTASTLLEELDELPAQQKPKFNKPEIIFKFENSPYRNDYIKELRTDSILGYRDITKEVLQLQVEIKQRTDNFLHILNDGIQDTDYSISKTCKGCEFNTPEIEPNGFKECWGEMAYSNPHIFDLYFGGAIGSNSKGWYFDELINNGKSSLFDIDFERLRGSNGEFGKRAERQLIQLRNTKSSTEWISDDLKAKIREFKYPLHFIDFETYTGALPFNQGLRPYELIAFQWSCHTIASPGATPIHNEWIHTSDDFPNFEFAKSLMNLIGESGTPLMWATHENTVLKTILNQMEVLGYKDAKLEHWLLNITSNSKPLREGRFIDMNKLTLQYYFHPYMKGKTSIKKVLPAVWNNQTYLQDVAHFKDYAVRDFEGGIIDPYDTLTAGVEFPGDDEVVKGGTAAMRAYHRIRFDDSLTSGQKEELKNQLLQYCKLDTMAMVIIAYHWGMK